jgi:hypothetical protein
LLLVVEGVVARAPVDADEVARGVVLLALGVVVAPGVVVVALGVVAVARGGDVLVARADVVFVRDGAGVVERAAVRYADSVGSAGAGVVVSSAARTDAGERDGGGIGAGRVAGGAADPGAAANGTGTPIATAVPPDSASTMRAPRAGAATAAGRFVVDRRPGMRPEPISPGLPAGTTPSASTTRTSRRSSTVSKISIAGLPPHRPRGAISSPFMRKESGASTAPAPIVTP